MIGQEPTEKQVETKKVLNILILYDMQKVC